MNKKKEFKQMSGFCKALGINAGIAMGLAASVVEDGSWGPILVAAYATASAWAFVWRCRYEGVSYGYDSTDDED